MKEKLTAKQHMNRLRDKLRVEQHSTDKPLLEKLERCFADGISRYRCKSPACVRCRYINIRRQQRSTFDLLGKFQNEDLAWVTVVLGATADISGVSSFIEKSRKDTKNRFVAARAKDKRWNDSYLTAWHEIDAVGAQHMPLLPPDRKDLVPALAPLSVDILTPTWLPTWHGVLLRNDLSIEEVADEFRCQWKLDHQVHVGKFDPKKTVKANLDKISSYANKFHCSVSLSGGWKEPWPLSWQAQYFGWLNGGKRNAFERLRMSINQAIPEEEIKVCKAVEDSSPMPFMHSFSSFPMHYNTGGWS